MTLLLTLRDGSRMYLEGTSVTKAKHIRRSNGTITMFSGDKSRVIRGKDIKAIESVPEQEAAA